MAGDNTGERRRRTRRSVLSMDERAGPAGTTSRRVQEGEGRVWQALSVERAEKPGSGRSVSGIEAGRSSPGAPSASDTSPRHQGGGTTAEIAATVIQSRFRAVLARRRASRVLLAIVRIQAWWRAASAARRYAALRARTQAARARDRKWSMRREYTEFKERQLESVKGLGAAKVAKYLEQIRTDAAVAIQRRWRGRVARRRVALEISKRSSVSPQREEEIRPREVAEGESQKGPPDLKPQIEKIIRRLEGARANHDDLYEKEGSGFPGIAEKMRAVGEHLAAYKAKAKATRGVAAAVLSSAARVAACDQLIHLSPPLSQSNPSTVRLRADACEGASQGTLLQARRAHRQHLKLARQVWWQAVADGRYPEQVMDEALWFKLSKLPPTNADVALEIH